MKVTALEEYGLRCMILLAKSCEEGRTLSIADISAREGLSIPYAGKLLMILRKGGLVSAERGRQGGYSLTRRPEEIRLKDVFDALGESLFGVSHCVRHAGGRDNCVHGDDCTVQHIWHSFDRFINDILRTVTLADLAAGREQLMKSLHASMHNMEYINLKMEKAD